MLIKRLIINLKEIRLIIFHQSFKQTPNSLCKTIFFCIIIEQQLFITLIFSIFIYFLRMEEAFLNKGEKFSKVEQKLQMLAQSKLQNLNQNTLKKVEDRLMSLEKGVTEEIASNQKIVRQYRLLVRKYEQQWQDMQTRCNQTSFDRSKKIRELKELMAQYFQRENNDSKQIYKHAPANFQEKIQRTAKQLVEQVYQRKEQVNQLDERVSEVVLICRQNVHKQFQATDKKANKKFEELTSNCELLRENINENIQTRRNAEAGIMQSLKETIGEIKQILNSQKIQRQKNKDKLCALLNNAKETIVIR